MNIIINTEYSSFHADMSALNDGVADLGRVIQPGYYSEGYPWQTGYEAQVSGSSIAQDGRDILAAGEKYTVPGMRLRDAIRHAEIVGDPVPQEAYARLESLKRKPTPKAPTTSDVEEGVDSPLDLWSNRILIVTIGA
jgi:hypothetical protein